MCSRIYEFHRHGSLSFWILQLLLFTSLSSCSVKEDRDLCPCEISLHIEGIDQRDGGLWFFLQGKSFFLADSISLRGCDSIDLVKSVPREEISICVALSDSSAVFHEGNFIIRAGMDCPPIFLANKMMDAHCDYLEDTLRLHKNFCQLTVEIVSRGATFPEDTHWDLVGDVNGYDLSGRPTKGEFRFRLCPDVEGKCRVNLPRQLDASLRLEMFRVGKMHQSYAVGEFMEEAGYDWTEMDLKDCSMKVDVSMMLLFFKIETWEKMFSSKIII